MNVLTSAYRLTANGLLALGYPSFWVYSRLAGRHYQYISERMGLYRNPESEKADGGPRIWLHAASVGEVTVAAAITQALAERLPRMRLMVTTTTEQGRRHARRLFGRKARCALAPLEFTPAIRRALASLQPDVMVCVETEFWPSLLHAVRARNIPTVLVHGRISEKSHRAYQKVLPLLRDTLNGFDALSMIRKADAHRAVSLGAEPQKVCVNGNAKLDQGAADVAAVPSPHLRNLFAAVANFPVWVVGSIRKDEEALVLRAFDEIRKRVPETVLIFAPRHLERVPAIARRLKRRGGPYQMRSRFVDFQKAPPIIVLDTMGELREIYHLADVVFCGGSLVPKGGQNILEPAAAGKPVIHGPYMDDFKDASRLLRRAGASQTVNDEHELARAVTRLLQTPQQAQKMGSQARQTLAANSGAAKRHAKVICQRLVDRP